MPYLKRPHINWHINVPERIRSLSYRYNLSSAEINHLSSTLPTTVEYMKTATQSADQLLPEYPFLIQKGALLIDGTIDLVVLTTEGIQLYDYKFSQASCSELQERYHEQLHLYAEAIQRLFPTTPILSTHHCYFRASNPICPHSNRSHYLVEAFKKKPTLKPCVIP